ncbi:MAG: hypothetical protein M3R01_11660, partial [Actinomycetota bacterium]|nr:hypothetical protein [Actinomycetota bacterium]
MVPFYTYFAGIGLGFLLVEVSQLQRLNIFLGHPTYALSVVLFSVLLSSGVGSMLSERFLRRGGATASLAPLAALIVALGIFGIVTPEVIGRMDGATTPVRIAVAVGIIFPLGLLMGMPFAIGMRAASARPGVPTAFLWGINGATSVCASVFGVVISLFFGIAAAFTVGALAYAAALVSLLVITRTGPVGEPAVVEEPVPERIPAAAGVG